MKKVKMGPQTWLYPMPVVMIGANVDGKPNFMTVAWCGIAGGSPPMISISIGTQKHTQNGIRKNMAFSVNIPSIDMVKEADYCGITSGAKVDKVKACNLKVFYGKTANAPMIEQCPINLECRVEHIYHSDRVYLIIGQIEETHISDDCLTDGKPDIDKIKPLTFIRGTSPRYHAIGEVIADAFSIGKSLKIRNKQRK